MTPRLRLMAMARGQSSAHLQQLLDFLEGVEDGVVLPLATSIDQVEIPVGHARSVVELELRERAAARERVWALRGNVVAQLRAAADERFEPEPTPDGMVNLASWVGAGSPAWHTVFSYSSPEPYDLHPNGVHWRSWFCSLDIDAQRIALLLVAMDLEARQRAWEHTNGDH